MKAILFSRMSTLDKLQNRLSVVRIPEVISRIKETQRLLDSMGFNIELINYMISEDETFNGNKELKKLMVSVSLIGLYERHCRSNPKPEFFIAPSFPESPVNFCLGRISFEELVGDSSLVRMRKVLDFPKTSSDLDNLDFNEDILRSFNLDKFEAYGSLNGSMRSLAESQDPEKLIIKLIKKYGAKQFVNIGLDGLLLDPQKHPFHVEDIQILDSIEIDPMLSWFRRDMDKAI